MPRYETYGSKDDRTLQDLDSGFIGYNNRLRPDQLPIGVLEKSENGRVDRNGEWNIRNGTDIKSAPIGTGVDALVLPFTLAADDTDASIADPDTESGNLVITNITGSLYASSGTINLSNVSGISNPDPNDSDHPYTKTDTNELTVTGSFTGAADASVTVKYPILNDGAVNKVYGSCVFSDPNSNDNQSYILMATNTSVIAVQTSTFNTSNSSIQTYTLNYGSGITVTSEVEMIQAFNKVIIFRKGDIALEVDLAANNITSSPTINKVSNGDYAANATQTSTVFDAVAGKVVVGLENHGYSVGDSIKCTTVGDSGLTLNASFTIAEVTSASPDTFTFFDDTVADVADSAVSTYPKFTKAVSQGLGFIHMPCPEFGILHQRRLIVPYQFDQSGSSGSATITSRKVFDELIVSDILDSNTYDKIYASFRFNAGASDFTVGVVSFTEDSILVFNKNSIYRVSNTVNPPNATTQLLTNEIGCLSRKSIAQVGKNVFFLSDDGVYSLEFLDEYNLRGTQTPLSEPIAATIDRINQDAADKAVGVYFDNRYYLAVPLDGNDFNSHILVYNFLTRQWESEDKINSSANFHYTNLIVAGMGSKRGVYSTNIDGGIHLIAGDDANFSDEALTGSDVTITTVGGSAVADPILGLAKTRMYTFNDIGRKKYNTFAIQAESSTQTASDFSIKLQTENIDLELTDSGSLLGNASSFNNGSNIPAGEDVALRGRIGNKRAYGAQFQIENTLGRPKIKTIKTSATQTFRSTNPAT